MKSASLHLPLTLLVAVSLFSALPTLATTPDCAHYDLSLQPMQTLGNLENISRLECTPELVVATGEAGLTVLTRLPDGRLENLGLLPLDGAVQDFILVDDLALLAMGLDGLAIVDLTSPANPVLVSTVPSDSSLVAVTRTGLEDQVATATEDGLIQVLDLAAPGNPVVLGELPTGHPTSALAGTSGFLYVGGSEALLTLDISSPASPAVVDVIDQTTSLFFEFVSEFSRLALNDETLLARGTYWYEWSDEWSWYYDQSPALERFDLTDPAHPAFTTWTRDDAQSLAIATNFAARALGQDLSLFDPATLQLTGALPLSGTLQDICLADQNIYVAAGPEGIQVVDATYPQTTLAVAEYGDEASHAGGDARYDLTFSDSSNGNWISLFYRIFSLADPLNPTIVRQGSLGGMNASPFAAILDVDQDFVAFSATSNYYGGPVGASLFDFGVDPYRVVPFPLAMDQVILDGDLAWTRTYHEIQAVSFADFDSPQLLGSLDIPGYRLDRQGDHWFCNGSPEPGLQMLDFSDPANPQLGAFIELPANPISHAAYQGYLLLTLSDGQLLVVDLDQETVVGTTMLPHAGSQVLANDQLVLAQWNFSIWILSLADPAHPVVLPDSLDYPFPVDGLALDGEVAYLGNYGNGPTAFDLSDPEQPHLLGSSAGPGGRPRIGDGYIRTSGGVYPLHCSATVGVEIPNDSLPLSRRMLKPAVPNPFNPTTELKFNLARSQEVELSIFGLDGRLVRSLVHEVLPAGDHSSTWDGRDSQGQAMPSGLYFARLKAGRAVESRKLALIK